MKLYCDDQNENSLNNTDLDLINSPNQFLKKQIIYLDRNNTPDIWKDIQNTIQIATKHNKTRDFKTVLIVPE